MTEPTESPRYPIEERNAEFAAVNYAKRIIEVVAVPYEEEATVMYRGELWREVFTRGAFDRLKTTRPGRVRANREHDPNKLCGRMVAAHPSREEGLVTELYISKTLLGDETLQLAADDCLSASVGFAAGGAGQSLLNGVRRIKEAFLDHVAFVQTPAYTGATVLAVRAAHEGQHIPDPLRPVAAELPPLVTPSLDEWSAWLSQRSAKVRH